MSAVQFSSSINILGGVTSTSVTSSLLGTASFALQIAPSATSSFALTASYVATAQTASRVLGSNVVGPLSGSFSGSSILATNIVSNGSVISGSLEVFTGSGVEFRVNETGVRIGNVLTDNHLLTGSLGVTGALRVFAGGNTEFEVLDNGTKTGNALNDIHRVTGSVGVTGSFTVFARNNPEFRVVDTGVVVGNALTDNHLVTGSVGVTGSFTVFARNNPEFRVVDNGTFIGNTQTDTHRVTGSVSITGSINVIGGGITASVSGTITHALTASYYAATVTAAGPFVASNFWSDFGTPRSQSYVYPWLEVNGGTIPSWDGQKLMWGNGVLSEQQIPMYQASQTTYHMIASNRFSAADDSSNSTLDIYGVASGIMGIRCGNYNFGAGEGNPRALVLGSDYDTKRGGQSIIISDAGTVVLGHTASFAANTLFGLAGAAFNASASAMYFANDINGSTTSQRTAKAPIEFYASSGWNTYLGVTGSEDFGFFTNPQNNGFMTNFRVKGSNGRTSIGRTLNLVGTTNGFSNANATLTLSGSGQSSTAWSTLSDRRTKEDIQTIPNGLEIVNRLNPVTYHPKSAVEGYRVAGYIAQEVMEVDPSSVHGDETGYSLTYETLTPYYAKAIQELYVELQAVKAELAELKNK